MADGEVDRAYRWIDETVESIRKAFVSAHPEHRTPLKQALDAIEADPYSLPLRPYNGHDAPPFAYVYAVPRTHVEIVFSVLKGTPGHLALYQLLDWEDEH